MEEYAFRLYEVFLPARFASGLVSHDLRRGFVTLNLGLVGFGLWCYVWPVRRRWPSAVTFAWLWVGIELVNGKGTRSRPALERADPGDASGAGAVGRRQGDTDALHGSRALQR
jgi:hypothetical protein